MPRARGLDGAIGGGDGGVVIAARGTQAEPRRGFFVQRHDGGAGIDHEVDALAVDPAVGLEMAAGVARNAEAAAARLRDGCAETGFCGVALAQRGVDVIRSAICAMKTPRPTRTAAKIMMLRMTPLTRF